MLNNFNYVNQHENILICDLSRFSRDRNINFSRLKINELIEDTALELSTRRSNHKITGQEIILTAINLSNLQKSIHLEKSFSLKKDLLEIENLIIEYYLNQLEPKSLEYKIELDFESLLEKFKKENNSDGAVDILEFKNYLVKNKFKIDKKSLYALLLKKNDK